MSDLADILEPEPPCERRASTERVILWWLLFWSLGTLFGFCVFGALQASRPRCGPCVEVSP